MSDEKRRTNATCKCSTTDRFQFHETFVHILCLKMSNILCALPSTYRSMNLHSDLSIVFFDANEVNLTICRFSLLNFKCVLLQLEQCNSAQFNCSKKQLCNNVISLQNIRNDLENIRKNNCWQTNFKFNSEQFLQLFARKTVFA